MILKKNTDAYECIEFVSLISMNQFRLRQVQPVNFQQQIWYAENVAISFKSFILEIIFFFALFIVFIQCIIPVFFILYLIAFFHSFFKGRGLHYILVFKQSHIYLVIASKYLIFKLNGMHNTTNIVFTKRSCLIGLFC